MKKFLGLIFVTRIVRKPKLELYWSMRGIFQTPIFPQAMSRNRIHTILDIVVNNFKTNYIPDREISLDEGMLGWRGRL